MQRNVFFSVALIILVPAVSAWAGEGFTARCVEITGGDTITVLHRGVPTPVRLHGINCPEPGQAFAEEAAERTSELALDRVVLVEIKGQEQSGVLLARIRAGYIDLSLELVRSGLAWHLPQNTDQNLADAEAQARRAGRGLWSQQHPVAPWEYEPGTIPAAARGTGSTARPTPTSVPTPVPTLIPTPTPTPIPTPIPTSIPTPVPTPIPTPIHAPPPEPPPPAADSGGPVVTDPDRSELAGEDQSGVGDVATAPVVTTPTPEPSPAEPGLEQAAALVRSAEQELSLARQQYAEKPSKKRRRRVAEAEEELARVQLEYEQERLRLAAAAGPQEPAAVQQIYLELREQIDSLRKQLATWEKTWEERKRSYYALQSDSRNHPSPGLRRQMETAADRVRSLRQQLEAAEKSLTSIVAQATRDGVLLPR